jgi:hypothetical protein
MVRTALQRTALLRPGMAAMALLVEATEPRRLAAAVATAMRRTKLSMLTVRGRPAWTEWPPARPRAVPLTGIVACCSGPQRRYVASDSGVLRLRASDENASRN